MAKSMAKFRETLWFKIGSLETEGADLMPIEDRYLDDGSVTEADVQQYSVSGSPLTPSKRRTTR